MNGKFYENMEEIIKDCSIYELAIANEMKEKQKNKVFSKSYKYAIARKEKAEEGKKVEESNKDPYGELFGNSWSISDWSSFSLHPQLEKDIRRRAIIDTLYNNEMICMAYIAQHSQLSLSFIKELLFISSPFFEFKYYNSDVIKWYSEFLNSDKKNRKKIIRGYLEGKTPYPNDNVKEFILSISDKILKRSWINYSKLDIFTLLEYQNIGIKIYNTYKVFIESTVKNASSGRAGNSKFKTIVNEVLAFGCSRYAPEYYNRKKKIMSNTKLRLKAIEILGPNYFSSDNIEEEYDPLKEDW